MKILSSLMLTFVTIYALAQPVPDSPANEHELQIGMATVSSQSIYLGGKTQTRVFPAIDYQYKQFYFQAGDLGYNLIDTKNWEVNFGVGVNLAGDTKRGDSQQLTGLPDLSLPVSAFISAQYITKIGLFKVKHGAEINNKHNGNYSNISYSAPIFKGKWLIMPQITYEHQSQEVVNYFVGVKPTDATAVLPAYQAGSVKNIQLSVLGLLEINEKWSFIGNIQNDYFGDEITDSPIIDGDQRLSVFAGFLYKFF